MGYQSKYLFTASMDVDPEKEDLFNEIYDKEHVPYLMEVPGLLSVARFEVQELLVNFGGKRRWMVAENEPKYSALYEVESPEVLASNAWGEAAEKGRWAEEVRPYTRNRRHVLRRMIVPTT